MYIILLTISIIIDFINIILGILIIYGIVKFFTKDFDWIYILFLIGIVLITMAPLLEILGIFSERSADAIFFFKFAGILANISAVLLSAMIQIANDGKIDVYLHALITYILYLSIVDIIEAHMLIIRIGVLRDYTIYYSKIGAILISFILLYAIAMFARFSLNIKRKDPLNEAVTNFSKYMVISLTLLISSYLIDVLIYPFSIARYMGPSGVAIFLYGVYYLFSKDLYFLLRYTIDLKGLLVKVGPCSISMFKEAIDIYEIEDDILRGLTVYHKMRDLEDVHININLDLRVIVIRGNPNVLLICVVERCNRFFYNNIEKLFEKLNKLAKEEVKNCDEASRRIRETIYNSLRGILPTIRRWEL